MLHHLERLFRRRARARTYRPEVEALERREVPAYTGPVIHAVNYSPTWQGFAPAGSYFDSDFANDAFAPLWGPTGGGRDDLGTIAKAGFNVVRLYNWSPTRTTVGGTQNGAHLGFLNYAYSLTPNDGYSSHLGVIVPVSDYFMSNDRFAWSAGNAQGYIDPVKNGQVSYDFDAAPAGVQQALLDFISSVTDPNTGKINPGVFAFSLGNEIELGGPSQAPNGTANGAPVGVGAASKLSRTLWWIVNLERKVQQLTGQTIPLTSPVSTADLGKGPISWFQAFVNGVNLGDTVPNATNNPTLSNPNQVGGPFAFTFEPGGRTVSGAIPGLSTISGYEQWYVNGYQAYQNPQGYAQIYRQYDKGGDSGNAYQWPGQKFTVPLLLTEMGISRSNADPGVPPKQKGAAVDLTAQGQRAQYTEVSAQAVAMEEYLTQHKGTTFDMGYGYFELTDEPTFKQGVESTFGAMMLAPTQPNYSIGPFDPNTDSYAPGTYPNTTVLFTAPGVAETFAGGPLPATPYPVPQLFPVTNQAGSSLLENLQTIFVNQGRSPGSHKNAVRQGPKSPHGAVLQVPKGRRAWDANLAWALLGDELRREKHGRREDR